MMGGRPCPGAGAGGVVLRSIRGMGMSVVDAPAGVPCMEVSTRANG
jgi:hypothetical protein